MAVNTNFRTNMKTRHLILLTTLVVMSFIGCRSVKINLVKTDENIREVAIHNAILDFSTRCNLYKKDTIFQVSFQDTLYSGIMKQVTEIKFEIAQGNAFYDGIVVSIMAHRINEFCEECCDKFLYTAETTVGSKGKLPSRYIEKDGKLFFWWDDDYSLTEEMLAILWKHNLLCDDTKGLIGLPDFSTNSKLKGADYYFCKNDLSKFKRVVTNIGLGFYKPPKLKCK